MMDRDVGSVCECVSGVKTSSSQLLIEFLEAQVGSMRSSSVSYDSNLLGARFCERKSKEFYMKAN